MSGAPPGVEALDIAAQARLLRRATRAALAVSGALICLKLAAWIATDSVAVLSSLVDSALDAMASAINFVAVRHALAPPDAEHRFGHGKAESIAGLAQAAFVAGSALFLTFEALSRLASPRPVAYGDAGVAVMVLSIVLTFGLVRYQTYVVRRTGSTAIGADSLHYRADLLANLAIIGALVGAGRLDAAWIDPAAALLVAAYILYSAWGILRTALDGLMDREFPEAERRRILDIAAAHPQVRGVHDLRTRRSGPRSFVQLHLELEGSMTLRDAHAVSDRVERDVVAAFPAAEVIVHLDPEGLAEEAPDYARPRRRPT